MLFETWTQGYILTYCVLGAALGINTVNQHREKQTDLFWHIFVCYCLIYFTLIYSLYKEGLMVI